jgi:hypothetical protein
MLMWKRAPSRLSPWLGANHEARSRGFRILKRIPQGAPEVILPKPLWPTQEDSDKFLDVKMATQLEAEGIGSTFEWMKELVRLDGMLPFRMISPRIPGELGDLVTIGTANREASIRRIGEMGPPEDFWKLPPRATGGHDASLVLELPAEDPRRLPPMRYANLAMQNRDVGAAPSGVVQWRADAASGIGRGRRPRGRPRGSRNNRGGGRVARGGIVARGGAVPEGRGGGVARGVVVGRGRGGRPRGSKNKPRGGRRGGGAARDNSVVEGPPGAGAREGRGGGVGRRRGRGGRPRGRKNKPRGGRRGEDAARDSSVVDGLSGAARGVKRRRASSPSGEESSPVEQKDGVVDERPVEVPSEESEGEQKDGLDDQGPVEAKYGGICVDSAGGGSTRQACIDDFAPGKYVACMDGYPDGSHGVSVCKIRGRREGTDDVTWRWCYKQLLSDVSTTSRDVVGSRFTKVCDGGTNRVYYYSVIAVFKSLDRPGLTLPRLVRGAIRDHSVWHLLTE